jgi:hypothetical protein
VLHSIWTIISQTPLVTLYSLLSSYAFITCFVAVRMEPQMLDGSGVMRSSNFCGSKGSMGRLNIYITKGLWTVFKTKLCSRTGKTWPNLGCLVMYLCTSVNFFYFICKRPSLGIPTDLFARSRTDFCFKKRAPDPTWVPDLLPG